MCIFQNVGLSYFECINYKHYLCSFFCNYMHTRKKNVIQKNSNHDCTFCFEGKLLYLLGKNGNFLVSFLWCLVMSASHHLNIGVISCPKWLYSGRICMWNKKTFPDKWLGARGESHRKLTCTVRLASVNPTVLFNIRTEGDKRLIHQYKPTSLEKKGWVWSQIRKIIKYTALLSHRACWFWEWSENVKDF